MIESCDSIKTVYLDQNVFADLDNRISNSAEYLCKIKGSIEQRQLIIVPSVELFDELVPVSQSDEHHFQTRWRLIQELVDWSQVLKPANEILKDDILSFSESGVPDNPFATSEWMDYNIIKTLADMKEPPSVEKLQDLTQKIYTSKYCFASRINRIGQNCCGKTTSPSDFTFAQYWQETLACEDYKKSFPQLMVSNLADALEVGNCCRKRGLLNLLSFPTILLPIGYWTYGWFKQGTKGCKEKSSVALDFRLCILAGAARFFVTGDKGLREAIKEIPGHSVKVLSRNGSVTGGKLICRKRCSNGCKSLILIAGMWFCGKVQVFLALIQP